MRSWVAAVLLLVGITTVGAQDHPSISAEVDRADMMRQVGITAHKPVPSSDCPAPDHADYDEALANPYPTLPDVLTTNDGRAVTTRAMWWQVRRPEIVEAFLREVHGRVPAGVPAVRWQVVAEERETVGFFTPVRVRHVIGHVAVPADAAKSVDSRMTVVTPTAATRLVPLLVMFGRKVPSAPTQPDRDESARIDAAMKAMLVRQDQALATVVANHPFFAFQSEEPFRFPPAGCGRSAARDLLPGNHAIGNLARQMETSDAAKPIYRRSDHRLAAC